MASLMAFSNLLLQIAILAIIIAGFFFEKRHKLFLHGSMMLVTVVVVAFWRMRHQKTLLSLLRSRLRVLVSFKCFCSSSLCNPWWYIEEIGELGLPTSV
jgi:hypothetical protein